MDKITTIKFFRQFSTDNDMVTLLAPDVVCNSGKDLESPF